MLSRNEFEVELNYINVDHYGRDVDGLVNNGGMSMTIRHHLTADGKCELHMKRVNTKKQ